MRLFLAITLPDELRAALACAAAPARAAAPHVRWVREESLHLTMKFLGERPESEVPRVADAVDRATQGLSGFAATMRDAGAFPNFRRPRAVWLGVHPPDPFVVLASRLDVALSSIGIAVENRPFRPHVTLGRVAGALSRAEREGLEGALRAIRQRWVVAVRAVVLMQSALGSGGSTYTPLAVAPLVAAGSARGTGGM